MKPHSGPVNWRTLLPATLFLLALLAAAVRPADAQRVDDAWSGPVLLSSRDGTVLRQSLTSDPWGRVHLFWFETFERAPTRLYYARFDGVTWTRPLDIRTLDRFAPVEELAAAYAPDGMIYLFWRQGIEGPLAYTRAPVTGALDARMWEPTALVGLPARMVQLSIDDAGTIHLVYATIFAEREVGLYYVRSSDGGGSWTAPHWFDPDTPSGFVPVWHRLTQDDKGGLHLIWYYLRQTGDDPDAVVGDWVRYAHSLDGGESWSKPITIDIAERGDTELRIAEPGIVTSGDAVHAIWVGDTDVHREQRVSPDRGVTWPPSETETLFGNLVGIGFGDGLVTDTLGRVHFFSLLRYPQGLYHIIWDGEGWSTPELVYLVALDSTEDQGTRIPAHSMQLAFAAGNVLLATFTSEPTNAFQGLYAMHRPIADLPAVDCCQGLPTGTPTLPPATAMDDAAAPAGENGVDQLAALAAGESLPARDPFDIILISVGSVSLLLLGIIAVVVARRYRD